MKNICIIPARGGSKRILKKNIKDFLGKPIIAYPIEEALSSGLFEQVIVSTDDTEIAEIAKKYGADVPFLRSLKNADDYATLSDVLIEVIQKVEGAFENVCCILPTTPLLKKEQIKEGYDLLVQDDYDAIVPIVPFSYPYQRGFSLKNDRTLEMKFPQYLDSRSQDLDAHYHDAGQFYWFKKNSFLVEKKVFMKKCGALMMSEIDIQDIDTMEDWEMAELKYKMRNEKV